MPEYQDIIGPFRVGVILGISPEAVNDIWDGLMDFLMGKHAPEEAPTPTTLKMVAEKYHDDPLKAAYAGFVVGLIDGIAFKEHRKEEPK